MSPEIHGHAVMDLMLASGRTFTRESLASFITEHFGPAARFHTCSAAGMTARELVDFLAARGKFAGSEEAFTLDPHRVCQH
ncbi:MAG: YecH family protein [Opitutae bacterium]|nr:YecH family protein [Opitutae bacterium]